MFSLVPMGRRGVTTLISGDGESNNFVVVIFCVRDFDSMGDGHPGLTRNVTDQGSLVSCRPLLDTLPEPSDGLILNVAFRVERWEEFAVEVNERQIARTYTPHLFRESIPPTTAETSVWLNDVKAARGTRMLNPFMMV